MAVDSGIGTSGNQLSKRRILIVDDEQDIRDLLDTVLSNGYLTSKACDGREAIDRVACERPDLITLDLAMPVLDGHAVLRHLAKHPDTAEIPVIVVSAFPSDLIPTSQVRRVISKPFDIVELIEEIDKIFQ